MYNLRFWYTNLSKITTYLSVCFVIMEARSRLSIYLTYCTAYLSFLKSCTLYSLYKCKSVKLILWYEYEDQNIVRFQLPKSLSILLLWSTFSFSFCNLKWSIFCSLLNFYSEVKTFTFQVIHKVSTKWNEIDLFPSDRCQFSSHWSILTLKRLTTLASLKILHTKHILVHISFKLFVS